MRCRVPQRIHRGVTATRARSLVSACASDGSIGGPFALSAFLAFRKPGPTADYADEPVSGIAAYDERIAPTARMSALAALTEAALRARQQRLARALIAQRAAQKPASRFHQRLPARAGRMMPATA